METVANVIPRGLALVVGQYADESASQVPATRVCARCVAVVTRSVPIGARAPCDNRSMKRTARVLGAGVVVGALYAIWRSYRAHVPEPERPGAWEAAPFPFPPIPRPAPPREEPPEGETS
jgi:hypothetical protein